MQWLGKYGLLSLLFIPLFTQGQGNDKDLLDWTPSHRLSWQDYKGNPDPNSNAAASTTTYLVIDYSISNTGLGYTIQSRFSKTHSWGLHKTDYILAHEQGHFDIAEIFARKLNREMSNYTFNRTNYQHDLGAIYQRVIEEKEQMQNEYDAETNHSINKEKQAEWLKKIGKMLDEYKDYSDYASNPLMSQNTSVPVDRF